MTFDEYWWHSLPRPEGEAMSKVGMRQALTALLLKQESCSRLCHEANEARELYAKVNEQEREMRKEVCEVIKEHIRHRKDFGTATDFEFVVELPNLNGAHRATVAYVRYMTSWAEPEIRFVGKEEWE